MRASQLCGLLAVCAFPAAAAPQLPPWGGYAANPQHSALAPAAGQSYGHIHWTAKVDLKPVYTGGELLIHYAAPMITAANTVLVPVKTTQTGNWRVEAHGGATGNLIWQSRSDYVLPPATYWTPAYPAALSGTGRFFYAGAGGTVLFRDKVDKANGPGGRLAFYGIDNWNQYADQLEQTVMIDTPITADARGDIWFGFIVTGSNPLNLASGIAHIGPGGRMSWVSAASAAGDSGITEVAMNCAPAVTADGKALYVAVSNGSSGYLLELDPLTLRTKAKVALVDPESGESAWITDMSSASPTIGPDGDVYYGVLENPYPEHDDRGWLLHFDSTLTVTGPPGSFGWDDTVSIVPSSVIPGYTGGSPYLLMTKYNNYIGIGPYGDGENKIAILDPRNTQQDAFTQKPVTVLKEVQTLLGPTKSPSGGVYEWCINSSAVDPATNSVFAGSEDGHFYRWSLPGNSISQSLMLNKPRSEAYTPSMVGPDGTIYAINNATLYAIGN